MQTFALSEHFLKSFGIVLQNRHVFTGEVTYSIRVIDL